MLPDRIYQTWNRHNVMQLLSIGYRNWVMFSKDLPKKNNLTTTNLASGVIKAKGEDEVTYSPFSSKDNTPLSLKYGPHHSDCYPAHLSKDRIVTILHTINEIVANMGCVVKG